MFGMKRRLGLSALSMLVAIAMLSACGDEQGELTEEEEIEGSEADAGGDLEDNEDGGGAGAGGEGAGGSDGSEGSEDCEKGVVAASQVILIGDSYPAAGALGDPNGIGGIQRQVEVRAVEDGVLEEGEHYRPYYIGGTRYLNGTIQSQYTTAKEENPDIKVVIMNGGGNDVLQGQEGCSIFDDPADPVCIEVVERSIAAAGVLMEEMQADGVTDVMYYFYPETPIAPGHSVFDEPYARDNCEAFTGTLQCHFISTIAAFEGHPEYISDTIHANDLGQVVIGDLIWDAMVENCVAQ